MPEDQQRLVVLLNGLGCFKYEELFVLFGAVNRELQGRGVVMADCECGELVTSLDMAGVSLSFFWLDGELEGFWNAADDSAAYRRGQLAAEPELPSELPSELSSEPPTQPAPLTPVQQALLARFKAVEEELQERVEELGGLDAVAGDGDHGLGMLRGIRGARESAIGACGRGCGPGEVLMEAGEAWPKRQNRAQRRSRSLWGRPASRDRPGPGVTGRQNHAGCPPALLPAAPG